MQDNSNFLNDQIEEILSSSHLRPRLRDIYRLRTGMDDGRTKTFYEIAYIFQISESAVKRLYQEAEQEVLKILSQRSSIFEAGVIDVSDVVEKSRELTPYLISYLKNNHDDLRKLPWQIFEHLIAEFFASWGYENVHIVGRDAKTSADIFAMKKADSSGVQIRYFIEVKRWKKPVGIEVINQVVGGYCCRA